MEVVTMNILLRNNLFDRFFYPLSRLENQSPRVDIGEDDKSFVIEVDLPGAKKEDVSVTVEDNFLTISSEIKKDDKVLAGPNIREERFEGKYNRSFIIPDMVNIDGINSKLTDGVLTLTLPKNEPVKKQKTIEIRTS
jgi:HSP20 family protein|tara:strand:+ start:144 stop:554 length:411 start_codon:yes stop_codon:yes gene_type:complete